MRWALPRQVKPNIVTINTLLQVASSCAARYTASYEECQRVCQLLPRYGIAPDRITYNTLLNALAYCADSPEVPMPCEEALEQLRWMEAAGVAPDVVTFSSMLRVCVKATEAGRARIDDADHVLQLMRRRKVCVFVCVCVCVCARACSCVRMR